MTDQLEPCPLCQGEASIEDNSMVCCDNEDCCMCFQASTQKEWGQYPRPAELLAELSSLKAQFSEIAAIPGLTETEDGLPGSVKDLVARLIIQRDSYKRQIHPQDTTEITLVGGFVCSITLEENNAWTRHITETPAWADYMHNQMKRAWYEHQGHEAELEIVSNQTIAIVSRLFDLGEEWYKDLRGLL